MCMWASIRPVDLAHGALPPRVGPPVTSSADLRVGRAAAARLERQAPARSPAAPRSRMITVPPPADREHLPAGRRQVDHEVAARLAHAPVGGLARRAALCTRIAGLRGGRDREVGHRDRRGRRRHGQRQRLADAHEVALRAVQEVAAEVGRLHPERLGAARAAGRGAVAAVGGLGHELAGRGRLQRVAAADQRVAILRLRIARAHAHREEDDEHEPAHGGDDTPKCGVIPPAARGRACARAPAPPRAR